MKNTLDRQRYTDDMLSLTPLSVAQEQKTCSKQNKKLSSAALTPVTTAFIHKVDEN